MSKDRGYQAGRHRGIYISIIVAFILARGATTPTYLLYLGLSLIVLGIIIRQYSILILGRYFTLSVKVASDQKVVSKGPYKYIRHPSYLGILVTELGVGVALGSWEGTIFLLVASGSAIGYRIHVEEEALVSELGEDYVQYQKKTKRLLPFIF